MKILFSILVGISLMATGESALAERGLKRVSASEIGGESRLALVIGNQAYAEQPLRNPVNDAKAIKAALERLGFKVIYRTDADQTAMEDALREFGQQLQRDGVGLFYYSGHGAQADGSNFLIPVQAHIGGKTELKNRAVDAGSVLEAMEQAGSRVNIVILDACRDNPFKGFRSSSAGLTTMSGPAGSLIAYATAPGSVAADGSGSNGVYTKHLLHYLPQSGLTVEAMFKQVRQAVSEETAGDQVPWENTSLKGEFCFAGCDGSPVRPTESEQPTNMDSTQEPSNFESSPPPPTHSKTPELENEVDYRKLASPAFQKDYSGKTVTFRAKYISEWSSIEGYHLSGINTEGRIFLNLRSLDYESSNSPLGSSDLAFPEYIAFIEVMWLLYLGSLRSLQTISPELAIASLKSM